MVTKRRYGYDISFKPSNDTNSDAIKQSSFILTTILPKVIKFFYKYMSNHKDGKKENKQTKKNYTEPLKNKKHAKRDRNQVWLYIIIICKIALKLIMIYKEQINIIVNIWNINLVSQKYYFYHYYCINVSDTLGPASIIFIYLVGTKIFL